MKIGYKCGSDRTGTFMSPAYLWSPAFAQLHKDISPKRHWCMSNMIYPRNTSRRFEWLSAIICHQVPYGSHHWSKLMFSTQCGNIPFDPCKLPLFCYQFVEVSQNLRHGTTVDLSYKSKVFLAFRVYFVCESISFK